MDINEAFINGLEKWAKKGYDDRISDAFDRFDDWIKDFDDDEKQILSELIMKFDYYTYPYITDILKQLSDVSIKLFGISNDNSIISVIRKPDGKLNSSLEYWLLHRMVSGLSKKIYYDSLNDIEEHYWENISNLVFIDDCSGTGKQFIKFLENQKKDLKGKRIFLLVVEIMKSAKEAICDYATDNKLDIQVIYYTLKEKALKNTEVIDIAKFVEMSKKQEVHANYIKGFNDAEALMAFYNNTPNDTLGIFWYLSQKNKPLFARDRDEEPGWKQINRAHKGRRRQQYESKRV